MMSVAFILAATLLTAGQDGVTLTVESETARIDPGRSVFVDVTLRAPAGVKAELPDFRDRVRGFSLAEDFENEPVTATDGSVTRSARWKLVPEPCARRYLIAPFVVYVTPKLMSARDDGEKASFVAGPVRFESPAARESVTGGIETDPQKVLPPFRWRYVGWGLAALVVAGLFVWGLVLALRTVARRVKEHRMSPIERAWVELDRLLKKGLPGRGRYKDFYVELTMVVRRYVQRKYGIRAPHLTTEEFLERAARTVVDAASEGGRLDTETLRKFLESADMVKFAGVEATPEMAEQATDSARTYLKSDAAEGAK